MRWWGWCDGRIIKCILIFFSAFHLRFFTFDGAVRCGGVGWPDRSRSVPLWFFQIFRISAFQIFRTAHLHFNVMGAGASVNDGLPTTNSFTQLPALPPPALPTLEQSGEEGLQTNTNVDGEVDLIEQPIQSIQSIESKAHVTQLNLPIQHKRVCDEKIFPHASLTRTESGSQSSRQ